VLLPARDEAPRLGPVLDRLRRALPDLPVFVVDGGSRDHTVDVARAAGAEVLPQRGAGYAAALHTGYRHLLDQGYSEVVTLDADGQHPPEAAAALVAALGGADWAIGSRDGTRSEAPAHHRGAHAVLGVAVRAACGWRPGDPTSGFHALGPRGLRAFAGWLGEGPVADANLRVRAVRAGLRVVELPVRMDPRAGGVSMHAGWRGLRSGARSLAAVGREAWR